MNKLIILVFVAFLTFVVCEEPLCSKAGTVCGGTKGIKCCENHHLECKLVDNSVNASGTCIKTCLEEFDLCGSIGGNIPCCSDLKLECAYERAAGGRCRKNIS